MSYVDDGRRAAAHVYHLSESRGKWDSEERTPAATLKLLTDYLRARGNTGLFALTQGVVTLGKTRPLNHVFVSPALKPVSLVPFPSGSTEQRHTQTPAEKRLDVLSPPKVTDLMCFRLDALVLSGIA